MDQSEQIKIATRLQEKILARFELLLDSGEMTSTDAATLVRLLSQNGWTLDPKQVPQGLRGMLTSDVDPAELDEDVIPISRAM